jgi:hypothetical protein
MRSSSERPQSLSSGRSKIGPGASVSAPKGKVETATRRGIRCGCCLPALTRLAKPSPAISEAYIASSSSEIKTACSPLQPLGGKVERLVPVLVKF